MHKYIFFDLDGTLTDSQEGIIKCVKYSLSYFGIEENNMSQLLKFVGPPLKDSFMMFYNFDSNKADIAVTKYRERFSTIGMFENRVYDGINEMLKQLKENGRILAVATSKPYVFTKKILEKYELSQYFSVVVGSELDGTRSTNKEVIQEVINKLSLSEEEYEKIVMVGDRKQDIEGAKAFDILSVGAGYGYSENGELEKAGANYITYTVTDLKELLLKL